MSEYSVTQVVVPVVHQQEMCCDTQPYWVVHDNKVAARKPHHNSADSPSVAHRRNNKSVNPLTTVPQYWAVDCHFTRTSLPLVLCRALNLPRNQPIELKTKPMSLLAPSCSTRRIPISSLHVAWALVSLFTRLDNFLRVISPRELLTPDPKPPGVGLSTQHSDWWNLIRDRHTALRVVFWVVKTILTYSLSVLWLPWATKRYTTLFNEVRHVLWCGISNPMTRSLHSFEVVLERM